MDKETAQNQNKGCYILHMVAAVTNAKQQCIACGTKKKGRQDMLK